VKGPGRGWFIEPFAKRAHCITASTISHTIAKRPADSQPTGISEEDGLMAKDSGEHSFSKKKLLVDS